MFVAQQFCISQKISSKSENTIYQSLIKKDSKEVFQNRETIIARAICDSFELMQLKMEQFKKYKVILIF